ncbi:MAG: SHOCT domain-containing protein [Desulfovibrio sp.]
MELFSFIGDFIEKLENDPRWAGWPFSPGYGESWGPTIAKCIFSLFILIIIVAYLRFLFGPKGIFRDKELDREAEETRIAELAQLEEDYAAGRVNDMEYKYRKKRINA